VTPAASRQVNEYRSVSSKTGRANFAPTPPDYNTQVQASQQQRPGNER